MPSVLVRLEAFSVLAGPLILGMALIGYLIRRDVLRIKCGEPIKIWSLRDKIYPDDVRYDPQVAQFMAPYFILFAIFAILFLALTYLSFFHSQPP